MKKGKSSVIVIGVLALLTFALITSVLTAAQKKAPVVVAKKALEAGTRLSMSDVEVVQVHAGSVMEGAFAAVDDVAGSVITVQRLPGDQVTSAMVGDSAQNALAQALDPEHRAVAINVTQASGLAGLVRPGDSVSVIAVIDPSTLGGMGFEQTTGPGAKLVLTGLKVLFVPYEFRYRELSQSSSGDAMSPVMSSSSDREKGVIILSVPVDAITVTWQISDVVPIALASAPPAITSTLTETQTIPVSQTSDEPIVDPNPTIRVSPVELLVLLNSKAQIHLVMEPSRPSDVTATPGIYMRSLLPTLAQQEDPSPDFDFGYDYGGGR